MSEDERAMIRLRLRSGRRRKAELGGYAFGAPPFGWRADAGELVEHPEEQETLARIRKLRSGGASLREIGSVLEREGRGPRRGMRWHPKVLASILARDAVEANAGAGRRR